MTAIDPWYLENLVCPRDQLGLLLRGDDLRCAPGHSYPVMDGLPIMLLDDVPQTAHFVETTVSAAANAYASPTGAPNWYLETLGISNEERAGIIDLAARPYVLDPVVAYLVAATNGLMYKSLVGRLERYPIPEAPLPESNGGLLLDVGCSWGRWSIAAGNRGYDVVGIDPSLGAVMAARRVAAQLGKAIRYVVGDARYLPFRGGLFDNAFSYSVIQHFSRGDAGRAVAEIGRVLADGGAAKVQMPHRFGLRCLYHQTRRGFREGVNFEVRYWTLPSLERLFRELIGEARIELEGFFGIGMQSGDADMMPAHLRVVLAISDRLRKAGEELRLLKWVADSVYVEAVKRQSSAGVAEG